MTVCAGGVEFGIEDSKSLDLIGLMRDEVQYYLASRHDYVVSEEGRRGWDMKDLHALGTHTSTHIRIRTNARARTHKRDLNGLDALGCQV